MEKYILQLIGFFILITGGGTVVFLVAIHATTEDSMKYYFYGEVVSSVFLR